MASRWRWPVAVGSVLVVALAGGFLLTHRAPAADPPAGDPSVTVAKVARADLAISQVLPGTLGFGADRTVKGSGAGVITWLPPVGSVVARGRPLLRVDDRPVPVFFGDTPLFRPLDKAGLTGNDVRVVRDNLQALGYSGGGMTMTPGLITAIKHWQRDLGVPQTGKLTPGQVVVLPGQARISGLKAQIGDPAASDLLTLTSLAKVISVPVDATGLTGIAVGAKVTVTLPNGHPIAAKVTSIGQAVTGGDDSGPPKVTVTVTPARAKDVAALSSAPVQVRFTTASVKAALTVPVGALVALREGGYAVQSPAGTLTAVTTGVFADGSVQISGPGVHEGMDVVTTP